MAAGTGGALCALGRPGILGEMTRGEVLVQRPRGLDTLASACRSLLGAWGLVALAACLYQPVTFTFGGDGGGDATPSSVAEVVVVPWYPAAGANWLDYVGGDPLSDWHDRADEPCDVEGLSTTNGARYAACAHGGELKRVDTTLATCDGVEAADDLEAFHWICQLRGDHAVIATTNVHRYQGLGRLIDFARPAWRANRVTIRQDGVVVAQSQPAIWWTNPVVPAPDSSAETRLLGESGTIYVVANHAVTDGLHLTAPRVALVVAPGKTLSYSGSGQNNCGPFAQPNQATNACFIAVSFQPFVWVEGHFDGGAGLEIAEDVLSVDGTRFSVFVNLKAEHAWSDALWLSNSTHNLLSMLELVGDGVDDFADGALKLAGSHANEIEQVWVSGALGAGILLLNANHNSITRTRLQRAGFSASGDFNANLNLWASSHNRIDDLVTAGDVTGEGVAVEAGSAHNVFTNVSAANNTQEGFWISGAGTDNNTLVSIVCSGNGQACLQIGNGAAQNTVSHLTAVNDGAAPEGCGVAVALEYGDRPARNALNQVVVVNGGNAGIVLDGDETTLSQVLVSDSEVGVLIRSGEHVFRHNLLFGGSGAPCSVFGAGVGLDASTCTSSTAREANVGAVAGGLLGKIAADQWQTGVTDGTASFDAIVDWVDFENRFRSWGNSGGPFPDSSNRGACVAGTVCQLWDWRLTEPAANPLRDRSGAGDQVNDPFGSGVLCPAAVDGDVVVTDQQDPPQTFLANAIELLGAGGDDDGLCESNETCVYSPNFGAYQGEGDPFSSGSCTFADGIGAASVRDVVLYAHPVNGVPPP